MTTSLIYEVECQLDPDIVVDYDAWLPGHVRDVLACPGFHGASIEIPETPPGERQRRRIRYRVESVAALDHYLENNATRLRTETAQRFGGRVHCERRVFKPRHELTPPATEASRCLNCGTFVSASHCPQCGQAAGFHVLSMKEVAGDVAHSLLHLDSRVWRTLKLLVRRPGELTREFIAGRHQSYIPPFRLYLAISILFFALQALLPEGEASSPETDVAVPAGENSILSGEDCNFGALEGIDATEIRRVLSSTCRQLKADGGKRIAEHFAATAPKLMFVFLPLMSAVALLFYWRPRRLYAEHLVLFLHNHAFTFLLIGASEVLSAISALEIPFATAIDFINFLLYVFLPWYIYRSMRVVYGEGRFRTAIKFLALTTIYFVLLGLTMLAGLAYTVYQLS